MKNLKIILVPFTLGLLSLTSCTKENIPKKQVLPTTVPIIPVSEWDFIIVNNGDTL